MKDLGVPHNKLKDIERRLDEDYESCFPSSGSWEKVAAHLLLAYDFAARTTDSHTVDRLKYDLMHVLRWGHDASSQPFRALPDNLDQQLFESCRSILNRGNEYAKICGAFISCHQGLTEVKNIRNQFIEFSGNSSWSAYDALDNQLAFRNQTIPSLESGENLHRIITDLSQEFETLSSAEMMDWFPDFGTSRNLISTANRYLKEGRSLPDSWKFENIPIFKIQEFWKAFLILGLIHLGVALRLTGERHVGFVQLLVKQKDALINWIAGCVGIKEKIVSRLLELHIYNRSDRVPDIALTPFVHLKDNYFATSPWMLISSNFERNLCAHLARKYPKNYSEASNALAPHMAGELVELFRQAGFKATSSVKYDRNGTIGDIDLLVWSSREKYVLAAELKWVIPPSDFMEVLNRGESTCKDSIDRQLPKYRKLLSENAGGFIANAFNLKNKPEIIGWDIGIVIREFVGTSRIDHEQYFLLQEKLLREKLRTCKSLQELCLWAKNRLYLPRLGHDYQMFPVEVISPSGIKVKFWECGVRVEPHHRVEKTAVVD